MRNLLQAFNILVLVSLLGCAGANAPQAAKLPANSEIPSWCDHWNTYGDEPGQEEAVSTNQRFMFHLGFFLTKSDGLREMLHNNRFDDTTVDNIITCYEENTPALVNQIDKVCQPGTEDQDLKVSKSIESYVSWCIARNTKTT